MEQIKDILALIGLLYLVYTAFFIIDWFDRWSVKGKQVNKFMSSDNTADLYNVGSKSHACAKCRPKKETKDKLKWERLNATDEDNTSDDI